MYVKIPPCRGILPIGHLMIDAVLLGLFIAQGSAMYSPNGSRIRQPPARIFQVQEGSRIDWDPTFVNPSPRFLLLAAGNLPAALISGTVRPRAHIQKPAQLWDPLWFGTHETISSVVWFLIGVGIDARCFLLRREMLAFLTVRAVCVALLPAFNLVRVVASLEAVVWLAFAIWGVGWLVLRLVSRLRAA
jgi:hypothetical protein